MRTRLDNKMKVTADAMGYGAVNETVRADDATAHSRR
jgi:hypothetical protein